MTNEKLENLKMGCATNMAKRIYETRAMHRYVVDLYGTFDNLLEHCKWYASQIEVNSELNEHQIAGYICVKIRGRVNADLSAYAGMPVMQGEHLRDARNSISYCGYDDVVSPDGIEKSGLDCCMNIIFDGGEEFMSESDKKTIIATIKDIVEHLDDNKSVNQKTSYRDCFYKLIECGWNNCECARRYGKTKQRWDDVKRIIIVQKIAPVLRKLYPEYVCGDVKIPISK